jgi:hypothetical protein
MGNLERVGESQPKIEAPSEVLEMESNLISEAKDVFGKNHELVIEAMSGLGSRKANEILEELSKCRVYTKDVIKKFKKEKEKIYS